MNAISMFISITEMTIVCFCFYVHSQISIYRHL